MTPKPATWNVDSERALLRVRLLQFRAAIENAIKVNTHVADASVLSAAARVWPHAAVIR